MSSEMMNDTNLYIQLDLRKTSHVYPKYTIEPSTEPLEKCANFEYVTQNIVYNPPFDKSYIFTAYISKTKREEIIKYTPKGPWNNIVKVECIYSYLYPDKPLIVGLKATPESCQHSYYLYRELEDRFRGNCGLLPNSEVSEENMMDKLFEELGRLSSNTKIKLSIDTTTLHIRDERSLGDNFIKVIYLGKMSSEEEKTARCSTITYNDLTGGVMLETLNLEIAMDKISYYNFDGIVVYENKESEGKLTGEIPLMIELYSKWERWQYVRRDMEGNCWQEEVVKYRDEEELKLTLETIRKQSESRITYLVNRIRGGYSNKISFMEEVVERLKEEEYIIYTQEPSEEVKMKRTNIRYKRELFKVIPNHKIKKENRLEDVQNGIYKSIVSYVMTRDLGRHLLVKFTTNDTNKEYCYYRNDMEASGWKQIEEGMGNVGGEPISKILKNKEMTKLLLLHINYMMRISIVMQIDIRKSSKYTVRIIKNSEEDITKAKRDPQRHELEVVKHGVLPDTRYIFYYQLMKDTSEIRNSNEIVGIRLCDSRDREIKLYNSTGTRREYIYMFQSNNEALMNLFFYYNEELPTVFCIGEVGYIVDHNSIMKEDGTSKIRLELKEDDENQKRKKEGVKELKGVEKVSTSSTDGDNETSVMSERLAESKKVQRAVEEGEEEDEVALSKDIDIKWLRIDKVLKGDGCLYQIQNDLYNWDQKNRKYDPDMERILAENRPNEEKYGKKITREDLKSVKKEILNKASGRGQEDPEAADYVHTSDLNEPLEGDFGCKNKCHKGIIITFVVAILLGAASVVYKSFKIFKMCRAQVGKSKLY